MTIKETHFEQVPLEVVELVLRQAGESTKKPEDPADAVNEIENQTRNELPIAAENSPLKGLL
jgi:hypothetical protein